MALEKLFYDTNAILELQEKILDSDFAICSVTLHELEHIKVSKNKDEQIKYKARKAIHILDKNPDKYEVVVPSNATMKILSDLQLENDPDNLIICCAIEYNSHSPIVFVSDDICCRTIARDVAELEVKEIKVETECYTGFKEIKLNEKDMAYFYEHLNENIYNLLPNQYLIIKDSLGEVVDNYKWSGIEYESLYKKPIRSMAFGDKLKPKDIYQNMAIDSLMKNIITAISGKAGSGKSLLSLMVAMHLIESGKYDKLVILYNPIPVRGAQTQGFYPGTSLDKALQSNIGQVLSSKFGDKYQVEDLIAQEKIKLVPMCDCRGMEIKSNEILWITECQNTSVDLLKLCLSRVAEGSKVIIEGDYDCQLDNNMFIGENNGMKRVISVFKGNELFGYVQLQQIWRSKLAELCDLM